MVSVIPRPRADAESGRFQPAPLSARATREEVHVWRVPLDCPGDEMPRLKELLDADERERAARFVFQRHRDHFAVGRARLRLVLGRYLGADPAALRFSYGFAGKPELTPPCFPFNVSHSDGLALIAIGGPGRLGIDIERVRPRKDPGSFRYFFAPAEQAALQALPPEMQERAFYTCWTRKEAYIKGRGDGLGFGLDRFEVSVSPVVPAKLLRVLDDPEEPSRWEMRSLDPAPDYAATLAVEGHGWRLICFGWESSE